jgi:hypothetical protein
MKYLNDSLRGGKKKMKFFIEAFEEVFNTYRKIVEANSEEEAKLMFEELSLKPIKIDIMKDGFLEVKEIPE